jgi:hypothetical protein
MHSRSFLRSILPLLGLVLAFPSIGHAVVPNRIARVNTQARTRLQHTVSPRAKKSVDLGAAAASLKLQGLTLQFNMTDAQQAALSQLLIDQQNPSSPRYHQWLTPQQFGAQFGLSADDIAKVSAWLTSQGFTVTGVANSSTFITFAGTAAQVQQAFGTAIHNVSLNGEKHIANLADPALPPAIAGVVSNITGLTDFKPQPRLRTRKLSLNVVHPHNTIPTTNGNEHFVAPGDFYTIYNLNPLISQSTNGSGITIAVMGQVDVTNYLSDVAAFRSASGLSNNVPTVKLYGTNPGPPSQACLSNSPPSNCIPSASDLDEALLDLEWAGASAPGANIVFVNSTNVIEGSLVPAIDNNIAPIMTVSYGACENAFSAAEFSSLNLKLMQANSQGITIFSSSGDAGATDCDYSVSSATQGLTVDFPTSSPYVTSVGGTMFADNDSYWNETNGDFGGSAKGPIPAAVWNETASGATSFSAGGGGASQHLGKPYWQIGTGVPNDFSRDVPDVSLNAAAAHDGYLVCVQGSCAKDTNGKWQYYNAQGNFFVFGGTSAATPSFAGITAILEQSLGGGRLGNINPNLYAIANSTYYNNVFHDTQSGNNNSPCTAGTTDCPNGGTIGYTATQNYDQATGWGSVDAAVLANTWKTVPPIASPTGSLASSTTLKTASPTCGLSKASLPLTVTVANGSGVNGPAPNGTVQFLVDDSPNGSPVPLSNGTASYTLDTTGLPSGDHTISVAYSGDGNYAPSKGTLLGSDGSPAPIDVISATKPDFSISPCTTSTAVKSGGTAPGIVFTLAPFNGYTGTITLGLSVNQSIAASYDFSTGDSVTINSTAGVPTTLTLAAFQSNANGAAARLKLASNHPPSSKAPWYITGSGATLACLFLLVLPRRRRLGALLAVILSVGIIGGASGCSSGKSSGASPTGPTNPTTTNAAPGTYSVTVTAVAATSTGNLVHRATVLFTVQ